MSLTPGYKLGPYEIIAPIGAGGMGEVYKARDTRLDRTVAIKVSGEQFSERFEREARAIAALNHPNICTLHDVCTSNEDPNFLVMEYIEGTPLKGPLPLDVTLKYAAQICDALDAAHKKGITHRDLKPANILVTKSGIKLLDFGLAKITETTKPLADSDATLSMALTGKNEIVGTLYYMSPEQLNAQATGQPIDSRSDIFSFGLVLYEMLTGKRAFDGASPASVIAAIMERPAPSIAEIAPPLDRVLQRCLKKDPDDRWQTVRDLKAELDWIASASSSTPVVAIPQSVAPSVTEDARHLRSGSSRVNLAIAWGVSAILAIGLGLVAYRHDAEEPPRLVRASVLLPPKASIGVNSVMSMSPDGRHIAIVLRLGNLDSLWVRDLDSTAARQLPSTDGAVNPFWSSDSRFVAFFAGGKLKKIDVSGGPAVAICDSGAGWGGAWNKDDVIIFTPNNSSPLYRVPASGGSPAQITSLDTAANETTHRFPVFLPDGKHFLFTARSGNTATINVGELGLEPGKNKRRVLEAYSNVGYVQRQSTKSGYLLYARDRILMAQPFDPGNARTMGDPVPLVEAVDSVSTTGVQRQFSASQDGLLVYTSGSQELRTQMTWIDRSGKPLGTIGGPGSIESLSLSPDGKTVAFDRPDPKTGVRDVWLHDLTRNVESRFTFSNGKNDARNPVWSPDGSQITFRGIGPRLKAVVGSGADEQLNQELLPSAFVLDWSRDGRFLVERVTNSGPGQSLFVLPLVGGKPNGGKFIPFVQNGFSSDFAKISPDSHWLAYQSNETNRSEIYVQSFPTPGQRFQVSTAGGFKPVWSRDGRELFFLSLDQKMMSVSVRTGSQFVAGTPVPLFDAPIENQFNTQFDLSPDGRFLIPARVDRDALPINLVTNWQALLKK